MREVSSKAALPQHMAVSLWLTGARFWLSRLRLGVSRGAASIEFMDDYGKAEPYRDVLWQSHDDARNQ
jgi:hypothetical protein